MTTDDPAYREQVAGRERHAHREAVSNAALDAIDAADAGLVQLHGVLVKPLDQFDVEVARVALRKLRERVDARD